MQREFLNLPRLPVFGASLLLWLSVTAPVALAQFTQEFIVPEGSSGEADSSSLTPFSGRFQQLYSGSEFDLPAGGWIRSIGFRIDGPLGFSRQTYVTNIQINLSLTSSGPDSLSPVFAENIGANDTVVYGPRTSEVLYAYSGNSPQPFNSLVFGFDTPFFYSPSNGNLLVDIQTFGGTLTLGPAPRLDAWDRPNDSVSRVYGDIAATSGNVDSIGLVTLFDIQVVPEPAPIAIMLLVGSAVLFVRRRN